MTYCDAMQVAYIDVSKESPCARGKVICFSLYCGSNVDFCDGNNLDEPKNMLWVDTLLNDEVRVPLFIFQLTTRTFFQGRSSWIGAVLHD